jgi:hypothetical protein
VLHGRRVAHDLAQHDGVLHRHAPTLAHVRRSGVGRVADEQHATGVPSVELDPLDHVKADLLVAFEGGEVLRDRPAQGREVPAEPLEPSPERVRERLRRIEPAEPVRPSPADWHEPEETAIAHHNHHVVQSARPDRYDAAPDHLPGVARRWTA